MIRMLLLTIGIAIVASGCSRSTVPPAALGKKLDGAGYSAEVLPPGKYWITWWQDLVLLDTSTQTIQQPMTVRLKDNLELKFDVRFRTRIGGSDKVINAMFNDIRHKNYAISLDQVYGVYGRDAVTNISRSVISNYKAEEIAINFEKITTELHNRMLKEFENSPLEVSNVTLSDIVYPKTIDDAIKAQAERRLAIETEQNQQAIEMVKKQNEMELAKADYDIRVIRANALKKENEITASGLTPELIMYRQLDVMEKLGENKNTIYFPFNDINSVGLSQRIYNK